MALNDVIRITATFLGIASNVRQLVWHYRQTLGSDPDYDLLVDDIESVFETNWADIEGYVNSAVTGVDLALATYDAVSGAFDTIRTADISDIGGLGNGDTMPGNVTPYVTFPTNVGRSTGKKFLFDVVETHITNSIPSAAFLADMALFAAGYNDSVTDGSTTWRPCNLNAATGVSRLWRQDVVGVGAIAGSQYRRILGIGL